MADTEKKYALTAGTVEIIKNFANINPQAVFKEGKLQRTCRIQRNFIADVELETPFPVEFALYDLNKFLGIIETCKGQNFPSLSFGKTHLLVEHEHGVVSLPYASAVGLIAPPPHTYVMQTEVAKFSLPDALWSKIRKTASVLETTGLQFEVNDGKLSVELINEKDKGGKSIGWGSYSMPDTVVAPGTTDNAWMVKFKDLEFLPGNYDVNLGHISTAAAPTKTIFGVFFKHTTRNITYIAAGDVAKSRGN